jgi:peptidoglycan hydrolase CwlO-like protein
MISDTNGMIIMNWNSPELWIFIGLGVLVILVLIKLFTFSSYTKNTFNQLNTKIDSLNRSNEAFRELNNKIDHMNKSVSQLPEQPIL